MGSSSRAPAPSHAGIVQRYQGHNNRAIALFEETLESATARQLPSRRLNQLLFATVLNAAGQHERARAECSAVEARGELIINLRDAQLALADAGEGHFEAANLLLDAVIERALPNDNPLALGNAHRDRATVALWGGDLAGFERHLSAMTDYFRRTRNPSLLQQREVLLADAVRRGARGSWLPTRGDAELSDGPDAETQVDRLGSSR